MAMWILVGDEASARLFQADDEAQNWTALQSFSHPESRARAGDIVTDYPNHPEDGNHVREFEGARFAKEIAKFLDLHQHKFERLVVAGPPRFLGLFRKELSNPVAKKMTDSLAKELTNLNERDLQEKLTTDLML